MKRSLSLILVLAMLIAMLPGTAMADEVTTDIAPTDLQWRKDPASLVIDWDYDYSGETENYWFDVQVYFSEDGSSWNRMTDTYYDVYGLEYALRDLTLEYCGTGYYNFCVRYNSDSATGDWVWCEEPYYHDEAALAPMGSVASAELDGSTGTISWTLPDDGDVSQYEYIVDIYYHGMNTYGEAEHVADPNVRNGSFTFSPNYLNENLEGYYSFTVSIASNNHYLYRNGEAYTVEGSYYYYPAAALAAPTGLSIENDVLSFDVPDSAEVWPEEISHYEIQMVYSDYELSYPEYAAWDAEAVWLTAYESSDSPETFTESFVSALKYEKECNGPGYYYFRVKAMSSNWENYSDSDWAYCADAVVVEAEKLPAPTELQWHKSYYYYYDRFEDSIGYICFKRALDEDGDYADEYGYSIKLYRVGEEGSEDTLLVDTSGYAYDGDYFSIDLIGRLSDDQLITGDYYFTAQTRSYSSDYVNSEVVKSAVWSYARPETVLSISEPVLGADGSISWTNDFGSEYNDYVEWYNVYVYHNTVDDPVNASYCTSYNVSPGEDMPVLDAENVEAMGEGYLYLRVRAYTGDITKALDGEWSEYSAALEYKIPEEKLVISDAGWSSDGQMYLEFDVSDASKVNKYRVQYWYLADEDSDPVRISSTYYWPENADNMYLRSYHVQSYGYGLYYYTVYAVTNDFMNIASSEVVTSSYLEVTEPEAKFNAPTELAWDVQHYNNGSSEYRYGAISFRTNNEASQNSIQYEITIYKVTEAGDEQLYSTSTYYSNDSYVNLTPLEDCPELFDSGTYYFTVQAIGDMVLYNSSDIATSGNWTYTKPEKQLEVSTPAWSGYTMTWSASEETQSLADCYRVQIYYAETESKTPRHVGSSTAWNGPRLALSGDWWFVEEYGSGYYYFKVMAVSADLSQILNSEWTELSGAFYLPEPEITMADPDGLVWGTAYDDPATYASGTDLVYNGTEVIITEHPGAISFHRNESSIGTEYEIMVYRVGNAGDEQVWCEYVTFESEGGSYATICPFEDDPDTFGSGTYYFTVQGIGNIIEGTSDSAVVKSETWTYTQPEESLEVAELKWSDGAVMSWTMPEGMEELVRDYDVRVYFAADENATPQRITWWGGRGTTQMSLAEYYWIINEYGYGWYYFSVRANTNDITQAITGDWSALSAGYELKEPEAKAEAPTKLQWGTAYNYNGSHYTCPGAISFKTAYNGDDNARLRYTIVVYKVGESGDTPVYNTTRWAYRSYLTYFPFDDYSDRFTDGTYYFTVQALGDGVNTANSEVVKSDTWTYTKPAAKLSVINPVWNGGYMSWELETGNDSLVRMYEVMVYYSATESGVPEQIGSMSTANSSLFLDTWYTEDCGNGWYYFAVKAYSADINVISSSGYSVMSAGFYYETPDPLGTASELKWHREYYGGYDGGEDYWEEFIGAVSWKRGDPDQARYHVELYKRNENGGSEHITGVTIHYSSMDMSDYLSFEHIASEVYESGTYYFTVQAEGDGINYSDSAIAISEDWVYNAPEAQLGIPTNLRWDGIEMTWDAVDDSENVGFYELDIYYAPTADATPRMTAGMTIWGGSTSATLRDWVVDNNGSGYYYFRIHAASADMNTIRNGLWSGMSPAYNLITTEEKVENELSAILPEEGEELTVEEVKAAVAEMDSDELKAVLAADTENTGATQIIAELEEAVGVETEVKVDEEIAESINVEDVSIVGAGLNAEEGETNVTLNIGPADEGVVIDTMYNNAVQFSMELENSEDAGSESGHQLAVPVKITLPIPANINPAFLVILHYHADGSYEELMMPHIYCENGQWYASFIVDSFSNFAMAEKVSATRTDDGIFVSVFLGTDEYLNAFCAAYSADGRMLGYVNASGVGSFADTIACDADEVAYVKLILLDENLNTLYDELMITDLG